MKNLKLSVCALALVTLCSVVEAATVRVPFESSSASVSVLKDSSVVVDLGSWAVGMRAYKTIQYTNTSTVRAAITNIDMSENLELVEGGCSTLQAGESCSMTFGYFVTEEGSQTPSVKLYVTTDEGAVTNTFNFLVQGVAGTSVLDVVPKNANFSFSGESKSFQITNTKPFPVPVGTVVSTNKNWTITGNTCVGTELEEGASCNVVVKYIATKATANTGSVNVLVNSIPFASIPVTGTIVYGYPSFDLTELDFKSSPANKELSKQLQLTNTGQGKLVIGNIAYSGDSAFKLGANSCSSMLEPGAKCSIEVKAYFSAGKSAQGSVVFNFSNSGQTSAYAGVTGDSSQLNKSLSVSPSPINFGTKLPGETGVTSVIVTSTGADPVTIGQLSLTGSNVALSKKSNCEGLTLASGASCSFDATFTAAATEGATNGVISVSADTTTSTTVSFTATTGGTLVNATPNAISLVGVDNGAATQIITLKNNSLFDSNISSVSVTNPSQLSLSANNCVGKTLKAGTTCSFTVSATSAYVGTIATSVSVNYSSGTVTKSLTIPASGKISAQGVSFANFSCPSPSVGKAGVCSSTITNKGSSPVTLTSISVDNKLFGQPSITSGAMPYTLTAGSSASVSLPYTINQEGIFIANVTVKNSVADASAVASVVLTTGVTASLDSFVCPVTVLVGDTPTCTSILRNTGTKPFLISSIKSDNPNFAITHTCGTQLGASRTCTISAKLSVAQAQTYSTNVSVSGSISLTKPISITPNSVSFEVTTPNALATPLNVPISGVVTYKNVSGFSVNLVNSLKSVSGPGFSMTTTTCGTLLANGASCNIAFKFLSASAVNDAKGLVTLTVAGKPFVGALQASASLERLVIARKQGLTTYVGFKSYSGNVYTVTNGSLKPQSISVMGGSTHPIGLSTDGCRVALVLAPGQSCEFYEIINAVTRPAAPTRMMGSRTISTKEGLKSNYNYDYWMNPLLVAVKDPLPVLNVGEVHNNTLTITNTSMVALNNIGITFTPPKNVTLNFSNPSCRTILQPGQMCNIPFTVTSNGVVPNIGVTLSISGAYSKERNGVKVGLGDNVVQHMLTFNVSTDNPAATLMAGVYPQTPLGGTEYATHTFKNTGRTTIVVQDSALSATDALHSIVEDTCKGFAIRPGTSCTIKTSMYAKPDTIKYKSVQLTVFDTLGKSWTATIYPRVMGDVVIDVENTYCMGGIKIPVNSSDKLNLNANQGSPIVCRVSVKNVGGDNMLLRGASVFKQAVGTNGRPETAPAGEVYYGFLPTTGETSIFDFFAKNTNPAAVEVVPGSSAKAIRDGIVGLQYEDGSFYNDKGGGFNIAPGATAAFILKADNVTIGGSKEHTLVISAKGRDPWPSSNKDFPIVAKFVVKYNVKHPEIVVTSNANYPVTNLTSGQSVTTTYVNNDVEILPVAIDSTGVAYPTLIDTFDYVFTNANPPATNPRLITNSNNGAQEFVSIDQKRGVITATTCVSYLSVLEVIGSSRFNQTFAFSTKSLAPGQSCQVRRSCLVDSSLNLAVTAPTAPFAASTLDFTKDATNSYWSITKVSDYIPYQQNGGSGAYGVYNEAIYSNSFGFFYNHSQRTQGIDPYISEYYSAHSNFSGRYGSGRFVSSYTMTGGAIPNPAIGWSGTITQFPLNPAYPVYQTKQLPALTCKLPKGWVQ